MFSSNVENAVIPLSLLLPVQYGQENFNGYNVSQTHHSDDPFITRFDFPVLNPQVITSEPLIHYTELQRNGMMNNDNHEHETLDECSRHGVLAKKPVKKDRHSKINTAHGLRDRRVRLSIGIAREFFDLQEMLGFDKASKTLEWLLNNSRKEIKELAQTKNEDETKSFASVSNTENFLEATENCVSNCKDKRRSKIVVKETRERAREKARDKMCNKRTSSNIMPSFYEEAIHHEESSSSIFVKKKLNPSVLGFGQPNLCDGINSKDSTSSNNSSSNWDINNNNNQFTDSALCSIHDVDLSGGFQVYGKPW